MQCTGCRHENPSGARFCSNCGAKLARACSSCGAAVAEGQKFCSACGHSLAGGRPAAGGGAATAEGERRQATVVFSDLSGYTALNERLDPEEVEEIMGRIKREATDVVARHGGTINQFVGDEVVALFGVPVARRDDAIRAVRAALELHCAVRKIGAEVESRIGRALTMHTGINTGLIVVRATDTRDGHYALTGDTVNTGARLLGLSGADEVVVGHDTWQLVSAEFEGDARAPTEVRGKERPITPYCVRGERTSGPLHRPLVGRTEEVRQLTALAGACAEGGRGRVLVVRGDPGIGKSRLMQEFVTTAEGTGIACHRALVLDVGAARGRDAVRSLVRSILGLAQDADEASRRACLAEAAARGAASPEHAVFLHDLLDLEPQAELRALHAALSEEARNRGTFDALRDVVRRAAGAGPLIVLVEDIHWADAWTLERLAGLAGLAAALPMVLALTTRFEHDPTVGAWRSALHGVPVTTIDLGPLPVEHALQLAAQFGVPSGSLPRSYVERAEGNPLFLEQLMLNAGEVAQATLPGSIQGLVLARLDRLPRTDRLALQAASALGQRFSLDALRHLLDDAAYECTSLTAHFLVRPEGMDFLFSHALIRDGAYESLLKSRRRQLHARAAEWMEGRDPTLAAEHYERAEHPKAPRAYLVAAMAEAARYHFGSAAALARRGLALATTREDRFALSSALGRALHDVGRPLESIESYEAALAVAQGPSERSRALIGLAAGMRIVDRAQDGLARLDEAEPLAREAGLPEELSRLHHLRGNLFFGLARPEDCLREHQAALDRAREAGSREAEANALSGLGDAHYAGGRFRSAYEQFRRCADLCREYGFGRIEVAILHMAGWSGYFLRPLAEAIEVGNRAVLLATAVSHHRSEMLSRTMLAYLSGWFVRVADAEDFAHLDAALGIARELGMKRFEGQNMAYRALLTHRRGDRARAQALAREAVEFCRLHARSFIGGTACGIYARVTPDAGERAAALAEGEALLAQGCVSHNYYEFYDHAIGSALEWEDWEQAERFSDALERYTSAAEPTDLSELRIARGRALARFGRGARDAALLGELVRLQEQFAHFGLQVDLPPLEAALAVAVRPSGA